MRLATVLLALAPIVAVAQPLIPSEVSLEARALNTRFIVVGTIVKIERPEMWTGWTPAVIKVEKWLKGVGAAPEMQFNLDAPYEEAERWRDGKARLMVFHDRPTNVLSGPKLEIWTTAAWVG